MTPETLLPVSPVSPFWANITGLAHAVAGIEAVAVLLEAVATVTYKGSVPLGIFVDHPLLIVPLNVLVENV